MEWMSILALVAIAAWLVRQQDQGQRIALLGRHLGQYQIERNMEALTQGYLRALGEEDALRREQIWHLLGTTEQALSRQFSQFAVEFSHVDAAHARVSRLPVFVPFLTRLLPQACFDMRLALAVHARGITRAIEAVAGESDQARRDRAFTVSAELFLMQHTCHWFCKSRLIASARMLARHQTSWEQLVASVGRDTRTDYEALIGRGRARG